MSKQPATPRVQDIRKLKVTDPDGAYQLETYQVADSIGYLLKRNFIQMTAALDRELAHYDMTYPQFSILMTLKRPNCSTAADLARETSADTGAITRMLDRLEAKQIIRRVRSVEDRRIVHIEVTDIGRLVQEKMPVVAINVLNRYLKNFNSDEITTLKTLLRKLLVEFEPADTAHGDTPSAGKHPRRKSP